MLGILGRIIKFPALNLKLLPINTMQDGEQIYKYCAIEVQNRGAIEAKNCWPQIVDIPYPGFEPQALAWGYEFSESPLNSTVKGIAPNDYKHFVLAWTSQNQSKRGLYILNIPVARRKDRELFQADLPIGRHRVSVTIIGDNFVTKSRIYEIGLDSAGNKTWEALSIEGVSTWARIIRWLKRKNSKKKNL